MIEALTRPMIDLLEECGTGKLPEGGPGDRLLAAGCEGLRTAGDQVRSVVASAADAISAGQGISAWSGEAADAAAAVAAAAVRSGTALVEHGEHLDSVLQRGLEAMRRAAAEITEVITSFVSAAAAIAPSLATPAGPVALITLAIEHLGRAAAIVGRLRAELSTLTAEVARLTEPPPTPPRPGGDPVASLVSGLQSADRLVSTGTRLISGITEAFAGGGDRPGVGGGPGTAGAPPFGTGSADSGAPPDTGSGSADPRTGSGPSDLSTGSGGVTVALPDGSTATAPNESAAQAVRSALTQQGVPYQWGGTTPGSGLDCSGLTQWAYGEAGVEIPRLAGDQSVGTAVAADALRPGDLAVWDGHVAMVIGNGQMIEAGDPVSISDVRTSNSGMSFHGFFRPTT